MSVRLNRYLVMPTLVLTMIVITVLALAVPARAAADEPSLFNNLTPPVDTLTNGLGDGVSKLGNLADEILPPIGDVDLGPTVSDTTDDLGRGISGLLDPDPADPGSGGDPVTNPSGGETASPGAEGTAPGAGSTQPEPGTEPGTVAGAAIIPDSLGTAAQNWGLSRASQNSQQDGQQLRIAPAGSTGTFANLDPVSAGLATLPLLGLLGAFLAIFSYLKGARGILHRV